MCRYKDWINSCQGLREQEWEVTAKGHGVLDNKNILKLDGCASL